MGAPAIFEKQIEIKLLHPASTEEVTDSGSRHYTSPLRHAEINPVITYLTPEGALYAQGRTTDRKATPVRPCGTFGVADPPISYS
jgi:hypothetical protein